VPPNDDIPIHPKRLANPDQTFIWAGDKDRKALQRKAWDANWWPERKKKGVMWFSPDLASHVMVHETDSDYRAAANSRRDFRLAGLDV
jgi:hypothetical protein